MKIDKEFIKDVWRKDKYFWIFLFVMFPLMMYANYAEGVEAQGVSRFQNESLTNAYTSAHFKCNRKGLWADLDTLKVKDVSKYQYTIAGGRVKTTEYRTLVEFNCTTEYKREPSE
jgi:hypothetical protein|tara:strand:+ start:768 stop:1112 length:345 start_codon:yes stop_codon:yes gene_type:complete